MVMVKYEEYERGVGDGSRRWYRKQGIRTDGKKKSRGKQEKKEELTKI